MKETYLLISDVAKLLNVEGHVLRYWEEELELNIPRNEFGHRYYGKKEIQLLSQIKELKEQGLQLRAIKNLIPELSGGTGTNLILMPQKQPPASLTTTVSAGISANVTPTGKLNSVSAGQAISSEEKMAQFRAILGGIVSKAIKENNAALGKEVGAQVSQRVLKEMDYLMRTHEETLEEHFQSLDQAIRNQQKIRLEQKKETEKKQKTKKFGKKFKKEALKEVALAKE